MTGPLVHLVRPAVSSKPRPSLVVLLHGVGSHEGDLFPLADRFSPEFLVLSVRAPLELRPGSYTWFPVQFTPQGPVADAVEAEESRLRLISFLRWAVAAYNADPAGTVLVGFSQGAILSASVVLTEPELVAGAVLMSGRILPEVVPLAAGPERLASARVLIVHGTRDDRLPLHHGQASRQTLRSLGVEPDYREFAMGHTITDESLAFVGDWTAPLALGLKTPPRS